jgi:hypothetical protein
VRTSRPSSHPQDTPAPDVPQRDISLPDVPAPAAKPKTKVDTSVLGQIERLAINRLTVTMPSTAIDPHRPMVPMLMLDFRERLLRGKVTQEAKDEAWRRLAERARAEQGEWNLFALGTGYPLLRKRVNKLKDEMTGADKDSVHFAIAREFLFALHRLDLDGHYVFIRLVDAAYTHASGRKLRPKAWTYTIDAARDDQVPAAAENTEAQAEISEENKRTPRQVLDEVITRANSTPGRQRITDAQATLIIRTHLEGERLRDVGAELGLSEPSASKQRRRAANTIARLLGRPGLADPPPPRTSPDTPQAAPAEQATPGPPSRGTG